MPYVNWLQYGGGDGGGGGGILQTPPVVSYGSYAIGPSLFFHFYVKPTPKALKPKIILRFILSASLTRGNALEFNLAHLFYSQAVRSRLELNTSFCFHFKGKINLKRT